MNIHSNIIKFIITAGFLVIGTSSFGNTLSSVEILQDSDGGRIVLNTTEKFVFKKHIVSDGNIRIKLSDTDISENLKYNSSALNGDDRLNIVQDGNSTVISISKDNISNFRIVNSSDNSPVKHKNNNFFMYLLLSMICFLSVMAKIHKNKIQNKQMKIMKSKVCTKTEAEKAMLRDLRTLSNRNRISNNSYIHGNPVLRFSNGTVNSNMSVPADLKKSVSLRERYYKTAVNS